ncbi:MAG TPA: hypothetical protein VG317_07840 [Pseudonocardiaceae bacterium]|nr:hypothetical protein [Pseudonocardiaceae bacterium]
MQDEQQLHPPGAFSGAGEVVSDIIDLLDVLGSDGRYLTLCAVRYV